MGIRLKDGDDFPYYEEGYESVALIALRVGSERLGLLQLNDRLSLQALEELLAAFESETGLGVGGETDGRS